MVGACGSGADASGSGTEPLAVGVVSGVDSGSWIGSGVGGVGSGVNERSGVASGLGVKPVAITINTPITIMRFIQSQGCVKEQEYGFNPSLSFGFRWIVQGSVKKREPGRDRGKMYRLYS